MSRISIAQPRFDGNELKYVTDCLESTWISSVGKYISAFERTFADYCGTEYAVATTSGTTALHLALLALGVGPGDEVIVPTVTYIATANAVTYCGATVVLVDVLPGTLNIDPEDVERKITGRTKGIIPVHLYGHPADMTAIKAVAARHDLWVLEDAAEAHGSSVDGVRAGSLGTCAVFSFFGNKIITTGEGGMVTTDDADLADRMLQLRGQGMDPARRYWFPIVGYNYRMTNIQAAIGLAQLERIDRAIEIRDRLSGWYNEALAPLAGALVLPTAESWARPVMWMYTVYLAEGGAERRDAVMAHLHELDIETRPVFYPMHHLPPYHEDVTYPVADTWAPRGINLPTHLEVTQGDVERIAGALKQALAT